MAYFDKFPTTSYVNPDGQRSGVKDTLRRAIFTNESLLQRSNYVEYTIKDGETPDMISQRFFDDPNYNWIILLFNEALDPFYSFPLSTNSLERYVNKKYGGQCLFIGNSDDSVAPFFDSTASLQEGDSLSTTRREFENIVSGGIEKFNSETKVGRVKYFNTALSQIQLTEQTGVFEKGENLARRKWLLDPFRAKIRKVVAGDQAVHHFETDKGATGGIILDPLASPPGANNIQTPIHTNGIKYSDTILHNYIENDDSTYVVTNAEYERRVNESKRRIRIPSASVVQDINREFSNIVGNQ